MLSKPRFVLDVIRDAANAIADIRGIQAGVILHHKLQWKNITFAVALNRGLPKERGS